MASITFTYPVHAYFNTTAQVEETLGWCYKYAKLMTVKSSEDSYCAILEFRVHIPLVTAPHRDLLVKLVERDDDDVFIEVKRWLNAGVKMTAVVDRSNWTDDTDIDLTNDFVYIDTSDSHVITVTLTKADAGSILSWAKSNVPEIRQSAMETMRNVVYTDWFREQLIDYLGGMIWRDRGAYRHAVACLRESLTLDDALALSNCLRELILRDINTLLRDYVSVALDPVSFDVLLDSAMPLMDDDVIREFIQSLPVPKE